ncbi:MAG: PQQ-binding-like beta-propeller repeat protein [Chloroflexi bacterium]|nr:PQQ-binding-like beta-propeller repeat protein [Chloroflexota bacterium]
MKRTPLLLASLLLIVFAAGCTGSQFVASSGWSGVAIGSDLVYAGARSGRMLALDVRNGEQRAAFPPEGQDPLLGLYGTPALANGVLYVTGYDGRVYALAPSDLSLKWRYPSDESKTQKSVGGVAVAKGLVVYGSDDGNVRALDASTGQKAWEFKTGKAVWSTPVVDGDTVYVGSLDHKLYALSLQDGKPRWAAPFQADGAIVSPALVTKGMVIFGSFDRRLYAVDAGTGRERWHFQGDSWIWGSPVTNGLRVFAVSTKGAVHAIDINTGSGLWKFDLGSTAISSPALVGSNLVVASDGGIIYVLAPDTGAQVSNYNVGAEVQAPLTTDGQVVYVNAMDKRVWAIRMAPRQEKVWETNTEPKKK